MNILQLDDLQQYSRQENNRIYGIPESQFKCDDGEKVIMEIVKELIIELKDNNIQRAHTLRKKEIYYKSKSNYRALRFLQKKNQFLFSRSAGKDSKSFKDAFVVEDLTPL